MEDHSASKPGAGEPRKQETELDFDYGFRPDYGTPADPLALIVGNIVGELRRRAIELAIQHGEDASLALSPQDREDFLSQERREHLASLHPVFTGGEFLPAYLPGEIEIGRFVLNTPSLDVIAARARPKEDGKLHYRVVDEYGGNGFSFPALSSEQPVTLGELVEFLDSIRLHGEWNGKPFLEQVLDFNVEEGVAADTLGDFLTAESYHYPELGAYYCERVRDWIRAAGQKEEDATPW